jgi:hypothetical protein
MNASHSLEFLGSTLKDTSSHPATLNVEKVLDMINSLVRVLELMLTLSMHTPTTPYNPTASTPTKSLMPIQTLPTAASTRAPPQPISLPVTLPTHLSWVLHDSSLEPMPTRPPNHTQAPLPTPLPLGPAPSPQGSWPRTCLMTKPNPLAICQALCLAYYSTASACLGITFP